MKTKKKQKNNEGGFVLGAVIICTTLVMTAGVILLVSQEQRQSNASKQLFQSLGQEMARNNLASSASQIAKIISSPPDNSVSTDGTGTISLASTNQTITSIFTSSSSLPFTTSSSNNMTTYFVPEPFYVQGYTNEFSFISPYINNADGSINISDPTKGFKLDPFQGTMVKSTHFTLSDNMLVNGGQFGDVSSVKHNQVVSVREIPVSSFTLFVADNKNAPNQMVQLNSDVLGVKSDANATDASNNMVSSMGRVYVGGNLEVNGALPLTLPITVSKDISLNAASEIQSYVPMNDPNHPKVRRKATLDTYNASSFTNRAQTEFRGQIRLGNLSSVKLQPAVPLRGMSNLVAASNTKVTQMGGVKVTLTFDEDVPPVPTLAITVGTNTIPIVDPDSLLFSVNALTKTIRFNHDGWLTANSTNTADPTYPLYLLLSTNPTVKDAMTFSFALGGHTDWNVEVKATTLKTAMSIICDGTLTVSGGFNMVLADGLTDYPAASLIAPTLKYTQ
jgi:hypothetical protein